MTLATRVQEELLLHFPQKKKLVDGIVGHQVRFSDTTTPRTKISFLTEATLLRTSFENPLFLDYDVIIVDEAHERSVSLDALMGALKYAQIERSKKTFKDPRNRPIPAGKLKVVVMTATGDIDKFKEFLPR